MGKYIAMTFTKLVANNKANIYHPQSVIGGMYDESTNSFTDDNGIVYNDLTNEQAKIFAYPIKISLLLRRYNTDDKALAIKSYISEINNHVYISITEDASMSYDQYYSNNNGKKSKPNFYRIDTRNKQIGALANLDTPYYSSMDEEEVAMLSSSVSDIKGVFISVLQPETRKGEPKPKKTAPVVSPSVIIKSGEIPPINTREIRQELEKRIIGQEQACKDVVAGLIKWDRGTNWRFRPKQILVGPTGIGKSEIYRVVGEVANRPVVFEDATKFTVAGYIGSKIEDIMVNIYEKAEGNLLLAQRGIAIIDEIDKVAQLRDISIINSVLDGLLKVIEGHTYPIKTSSGMVKFNTSNLFTAFSGAFYGLDEIKKKVGFASEDDLKSLPLERAEELRKMFVDYGMKLEFFGRITSVIELRDLTVDEFLTIMQREKHNAFADWIEIFKTYNVVLNYDEEFLRLVAEHAKKLGTGVRGIQNILDYAFKEANLDCDFAEPSGRQKILRVSPETVTNNKAFDLS